MLAIVPPAGSCHISHRQNSQISFPPLIYAPYCKPQPAPSVDISFFPAVYYTSVCANFLGKGGYGMSVKAQVLSALDAARGRYISGQELADQLGVSRAAIWKAVTALRADGTPIEAITNRGYALPHGADLLNALGLGNGANRYEKADGSDQLDDSNYYYQSDVLISALSTALKANATTVKNALEAYVTESGTAMPLTDTYGKTKAENLELGLYLVVETRVPEMVTSTCNPFFICLPMTSSGGSWIYDVTVYPKNLTGNPTLDKTLRESKDDTGNHKGTNDIDDGYAETGTASDGDSVDYQIISTLPSITSASTYLTSYTFADTLSRGITYNKHDVVLEFFTDAACTDPVAKWAETDGKFTVTYSSTDTGESGMTIEMTADGLKEMNTAVYSDASMVNSGYSDCTLRITYAATVNSSADVVYGDNGNPNEVVLTWKRTSQNSYDTLKDDARVFTYGLELTKLFSDGKGDFSKVQFIMQNKTDGYYVKARLDEATGVYYVTDHVADKKDATRLVPTAKDGKGKILVKGLEDDEYTVTEIKTADGYTLLKKGISVVISRKDASTSAAVDGKQAAMLADNGSANALVPLSVVNTSGFDLPATGDRGVWMYGLAGILLMTASAACIIIARKRFK